MTDLGRNIEALRKKLGSIERELPYAGLARKLTEMLRPETPIAPSTILKWEQGLGGTPNPWQLIALAKLAGMSVEEFAGKPPAGEAKPEPGPTVVVPTEQELAARALEALRQSREKESKAIPRKRPKRGKGR